MAISPKKRALALVVVLIVAGAVAYYFLSRHHAPEKTVTIYGNIDIRQVQAAFDDNGRLLDLRVQEGDRVKKGQLLADLDPVRFQDAVDKDAAGMAAQEQVLARLLAGSRPEEIAEARAE
ncbi:biotin/lipoyl-binding protein, partial [Acidithiobacillus sp. MC2.1]